MFTLPHNTVAYLYKEAIDMRLGMLRLQGVIALQLSQPMCFFLFINKPHTLLKAVWFDGTGLCLFCKRLEQGQFSKSEKVVHEKIGIKEVEQAAVSPPEVPAKDVAGKQVLTGKKSRRGVSLSDARDT